MDTLYKTDNRRKPKIRRGINYMKCIARAVGLMFHVSPEFLGIPEAQYNDFFEQLLELKYIRRVRKGPYVAENFNITPEGEKFYRRKGKNIKVEQTFKYGFGETTIAFE